MKLAAIALSLTSELLYSCLMVVTWIVLLGWSAALISACTLVFRQEPEKTVQVEGALPSKLDRSRHAGPIGFGR